MVHNPNEEEEGEELDRGGAAADKAKMPNTKVQGMVMEKLLLKV